MKTYIAYIRVSTARQAQGVSLTEQRRAIERYALSRSLRIRHWYEEVQTAAKGGRSVFREAMRTLAEGNASGLILHKIDRGVRRLRDWADLGELIDQGIDVRFAHDDLDMESRGGRLSADIQAVIAADYIRNLRDEVRKGNRGRLAQGLYPLPAPIGYRNRGGGRAKVPDPFTAPIVARAFSLYATGQYSLEALSGELDRLGLSNRSDRPLSPFTVSRLLRRRFYVGTCQVKGVNYEGVHQPLVSEDLFDQVQRQLRRRSRRRHSRYSFRYAGRFEHVACGHVLTGERQKGRTYYRCHHCPRVSISEDLIDRTEAASEFESPSPSRI